MIVLVVFAMLLGVLGFGLAAGTVLRPSAIGRGGVVFGAVVTIGIALLAIFVPLLM
ncbi:hypothetical protein ACFVYE_45265 [Streptomyces sp. NPDC058239]|uniref:hypothetical protein n=1 Tax=Streptomyces sp. NPDC058239 TaxID=3346395 RepID=UPI0036E60875